MAYFVSPSALWKAQRIRQMLKAAGTSDIRIYARPDGQTLLDTSGHLILFDLNELGELYKVDNVDVTHPQPDNTFVIQE
jgi:hypothetical protein